MGLGKEQRDETIATSSLGERVGRFVKTYAACFWSFLVSIAGGVMLGWWEYAYHPSNRQLWMVPFGLILFSTPAFIWFAVFVSDFCDCSEVDQLPVKQSDVLVRDPERSSDDIKPNKY
ncbi:hypothetical protein SLE2022_030530 [Rubroshorea leprosula]|uniref:Uncharacterized protein n=1 Tax=Rubroshorea leprosula TaxID=152421 RepID=A0AAV5JS28_9ROSI|nr:hypothetical protein SLEP1_g24220 [Rubroshorea leprosula]